MIELYILTAYVVGAGIFIVFGSGHYHQSYISCSLLEAAFILTCWPLIVVYRSIMR
jgi:hypothetical protein